MLIYMLAIAMTVLMLIATAFSVLQEAQGVKAESNKRRFDDFGSFGR